MLPALLLALPPTLRAADDGLSALGSPQREPATAATINVDSDPRSDERIAQRLTDLYAALDGLAGVRVNVSSGVVELSGEVLSRAAHAQAVTLARRVANVVDVQDRVVETSDIRSRLLPIVDRLRAQFIAAATMLPLLGVALLVAAAFWWLAGQLSRRAPLGRLFRRNPFLEDLARQLLRLSTTVVGLVLALQILDASKLIGTLLGAAGVIGLALGFALRDTIENYIASLLLSLRQPFASDDLVDIEGCEGRVLRLTPRATLLMTLDGNHTRIPNAKVYKAVIVNYTRNPKRRFCFDVGVDTEQNLAAAQELAAGTLLGMDGVLDEPAPMCTVEALGDSNVMLRVFGWVDQRRADFLKVRSEAIRLVKRAFDEAGIVMPEPLYNVRLREFPATADKADGADGAEPAAAAEDPRERAANREPGRALDIGPQDPLDRQIAAERLAGGHEDLLSANSPRE